MMRSIFVLFIVLLVVSGCKPTGQTQTVQDGKYSEDLSALRPKVDAQPDNTTTPEKNKRDPKAYVEPQFTVNKQLDAVLDSIDRINLAQKSVKGYTIQVYSGLKREDALNVKKQLTISLPHLVVEVQYLQPNFRVKSGKYYTLLEAEKDFEQIKRYFQAAIVVPDNITIN